MLPAHADLFLAFFFVLHVVSKCSLTDDGKGGTKGTCRYLRLWSRQMPNPQDWYFLPTYLKVPRYMYVLIHLLGQKLNMCSYRFIALGWMVSDY